MYFAYYNTQAAVESGGMFMTKWYFTDEHYFMLRQGKKKRPGNTASQQTCSKSANIKYRKCIYVPRVSFRAI